MGIKVNVLGTEYEIILRDEWEDANFGDGCAGYCDVSSKSITMTRNPSKRNMLMDDLTVERSRILRHELVHAFLYESGMHEWYLDEKIVDWISIQIPKIQEAAGDAMEYIAREVYDPPDTPKEV